MDKNNETNNEFIGKVAFLGIRKWSILGLKAEKKTHWSLKSNIEINSLKAP